MKLIHYACYSLDPSEVFIRARMTSAGRPDYLCDDVVNANTSMALLTSPFHFREISCLKAKEYLKEKGI